MCPQLMFGHDYTCDRCSQTATYISAGTGCYRLSDGTDIPRATQPVWCNCCDALRCAERLPELERLQQVLADLESNGLSEDDLKNAEAFQQSPESYLDERLNKWRVSVRWRSERQSPPRCLDCESTDLLFLALDIEQALESFPHPTCGGTFTQTNWWHGSQATYQVLNAEGRHLNGESTVT